MERFKVGDVVQLNSGGPPLTITEVDTSREGCHVMWFVNNEIKTTYVTNMAALRRCE
jgi:uncharacterized protein YodC (DUF2158 family)